VSRYNSGYKAWALFDGTAEAYVHTTLIKKWDVCPGDAILRSYGGKMTRLNGDEIKYGYQTDALNEGGIIAALHKYDTMQEALKDAFGA
jgi:inositol monophosphatase 3